MKAIRALGAPCVMLAMLLVVNPAVAKEASSSSDSEKKRSNNYLVIKKEYSFFGSLWSRLKVILPSKKAYASQGTAVLGVRGSETTQSALVPHWQGDLTKDKEFLAGAELLRSAIILCESENKEKGIQVFKQMSSNKNLAFVSSSLVGMASCYSELGENDLAKESLMKLVRDFPTHPMVEEIKNWAASDH